MHCIYTHTMCRSRCHFGYFVTLAEWIRDGSEPRRADRVNILHKKNRRPGAQGGPENLKKRASIFCREDPKKPDSKTQKNAILKPGPENLKL